MSSVPHDGRLVQGRPGGRPAIDATFNQSEDDKRSWNQQVPSTPLVVLALIEGGVNRGPPRPVALDQPTVMRDQDTSPDAHPWIWTQRTVRDLQHDSEHVLVGEEVFARPRKLFAAPTGSAKNGSLRSPAKNRKSPAVVIRGSVPKVTGAW